MPQPSPGDADAREEDALLARTDSAGRRRRRSSPVQSASPRPAHLGGGPRRQSSFRHDVGHSASETYLVTRHTFTLLQYLGLGYRWMTQLLALAIYAILLMPGFLQGWICIYPKIMVDPVLVGLGLLVTRHGVPFLAGGWLREES